MTPFHQMRFYPSPKVLFVISKSVPLEIRTIKSSKKYPRFLQFQSYISQFWNANNFILEFPHAILHTDRNCWTNGSDSDNLTSQQHCGVQEEHEPFSWQKTGGSFFQGPHGIRAVAWNIHMISIWIHIMYLNESKRIPRLAHWYLWQL